MMIRLFLRHFIQPVIGKVLWQERVAALLYLASLGMVVYLIYSMLTSPFYFQKLGIAESSQEMVGLLELPQLETLDVYNQVAAAHPVFGASQQEVAASSKNPCEDFIQNFSLSGIIQGGQNEAIFLNKRTRQTHFVSSGDNLENISVQSIQNHSVMILCAGVEREILIEET